MWLKNKQIVSESSAIKYTLLDESESQPNENSDDDLFPVSHVTISPFNFINVSQFNIYFVLIYIYANICR